MVAHTKILGETTYQRPIRIILMPPQIVYPQLTTNLVYKKNGLIGFLWKVIRNFLAMLGLLVLGSLLFLYIQGQQVAHSFDKEFMSFFSRFVVDQLFLKKDVASAMLIKTSLKEEVTIKQAINAMKKYANQLNIKLINSYPLHETIKRSTGKSFRFVEIFEFCDASLASSLLEHNPDFAAYLPCRIAMYEDLSGKIWFATLNMELLLHGTQGIEPYVKVQASKIQESLLKIMGAGASGVIINAD